MDGCTLERPTRQYAEQLKAGRKCKTTSKSRPGRSTQNTQKSLIPRRASTCSTALLKESIRIHACARRSLYPRSRKWKRKRTHSRFDHSVISLDDQIVFNTELRKQKTSIGVQCSSRQPSMRMGDGGGREGADEVHRRTDLNRNSCEYLHETVHSKWPRAWRMP